MSQRFASKLNSTERRRHMASIALAKLANLYSRNKLPPKPGSKWAEFISSYFEYKKDLITRKRRKMLTVNFAKNSHS